MLNGRRPINSPGFQRVCWWKFYSCKFSQYKYSTCGRNRTIGILRDGASAIYGADAVAGVINTVLNRNFDGLSVKAKFTEFENFSRSDHNISFNYGSEINGGRGNFTFHYSRDREPIKATEDERMGISIGESFQKYQELRDSTRFRRDSTNSPYGQFDIIPTVKDSELYKTFALTDSSGEFEIFPADDPKCQIILNNSSCIVPDTITKRYNMNSERWIYSRLKRDNLFLTFDYDLSSNLTFFSDVLYYKSDTIQNNSPSAAFSTSRIIVPANNYWNPFGQLILTMEELIQIA